MFHRCSYTSPHNRQ